MTSPEELSLMALPKTLHSARSHNLNTLLSDSELKQASTLIDAKTWVFSHKFESRENKMNLDGENEEERSVAITPTWALAAVLSVFIAVSLIVERSIHQLTNWLRRTDKKSLLAALEKMKEELMMLGFMSLLLTATSRSIANICIPSKFYDDSSFAPCSWSDIVEENEHDSSKELQLSIASASRSFPRILKGMNTITCKEIRSWRAWENEAHKDQFGFLTGQDRQSLMERQMAFIVNHRANPLTQNRVVIWVICFFRQFGCSVVRADYLTLRKGFIVNHNLILKYDFHSYMVRSMEEEFQKIVGVSFTLWGFVVIFILFNVKGSNLYFWIAIIPITFVLLVGAKLQNVMATLTLESAGITGYFTGTKLTPRDELFWFKKPEWLLSLIHFILFQWEFGYNSCLISNHTLVFIRVIMGFIAQFICSYITLPLYALVTQMGTNFKAALLPQGIRNTIHGWGKEARRRRRRRLARFTDRSTIDTETCSIIMTDTNTITSVEEDYHHLIDTHEPRNSTFNDIELQPVAKVKSRRTIGSF
ncbi:hypothetical protein E1A91_D01G071300v1 [Gossypium mustelinum]|uniref:MLO-like protein n=1 Tax=Gossypium mustelinum TaxID=34275 RepID=A0A5D2W451_GOSMU|nr:hypothetical protein E1A91_D01G071300v1 [Gossypium mustelinum]